MIYSKWQADKGGYTYYETAERRGLGDDLPIPRLSQASNIGVASTDIGRALPLGAKIVGYGPIARGCVTVLDRSGLSGFGAGTSTNAVFLVGAAIASVAVGAILTRKAMR